MDYIRTKYPEIIEDIDTNKVLTDELIEKIVKVVKEFKK